jgi:hypothetical protein
VLELQCTRQRRAVVMFSDATERNQSVGICERPAPTIETDHATQQHDGFVSKRIAVKSRCAEALESLAAATAVALGSHAQSIGGVRRSSKNPNLLGLPCRARCSGIG